MFCTSTTTTLASAGGDRFSWDDVETRFPSVVDFLRVLGVLGGFDVFGVLDVLNVLGLLCDILCVADLSAGQCAGHC